jgi:hypothetical protein
MAALAGDVNDGFTDAAEGMSIGITEDGNPGKILAFSSWYAVFILHEKCSDDA